MPVLTDDVKASIRAEARLAWEKMDQNQRTGVRFGLFDAKVCEHAGYGPGANPDESHQFVLALMACAQADGGMRA